MGIDVSVQDEKVLEMGCITMRIYLILLNYILIVMQPISRTFSSCTLTSIPIKHNIK